MSDLDKSGVTFTEVSSPFEDLSDIGSPRVDDHEYLELPWMPEDPYVEAALQAPPSPDYVPGPEEPDHMLRMPYPLHGGDDEDPDEDPVDYPTDGGDDEDNEDEPLEEDEDDDVDMEADEDKEEEEHPAPADSVVVALPAIDQAPCAEETQSFETDESAATPPPHLAYRVTARISIPAPLPTPVWSDAEIPSPSLPLSPSPPSPVLSPAPPPSPIRSLGYRAVMIRLRAEAASTSHSLPLPHPSYSPPPDQMHHHQGYHHPYPYQPARGLRADYGFVATMDREIRCDPEREVGYGITDSWDEIVKTLHGALVNTDTELGRHMTTFETKVRQDTDEIYMRLDDEQSQRQLLAGRLNMLFRDRRAHAYTRHLMEIEARLSREAWRRSMDASDLARGEVMSLRTTVLGQMSEIRELHAADHKRQAVTSKMLKADHRRSAEMRELRTVDRTRQQQLIQTLTVMQSLQGQVTTLQGQVTTLQGQVTALQGQQGPTGGPAQLELSEEAVSSS
ncbi:hypothetical protein Tco_1160034 [Tanacetum coccineum]